MPPSPSPTRGELLDALAQSCWLAHGDGEAAFAGGRFADAVLCAIRALEQATAWGYEQRRRSGPPEPVRGPKTVRFAFRAPVPTLVVPPSGGDSEPAGTLAADPFDTPRRRADWLRAHLGFDRALTLKAKQLVAMERDHMNFEWAVQLPGVRARASGVAHPPADVGALPIPAWPQDFTADDARPWLDMAAHVARRLGVPEAGSA